MYAIRHIIFFKSAPFLCRFCVRIYMRIKVCIVIYKSVVSYFPDRVVSVFICALKYASSYIRVYVVNRVTHVPFLEKVKHEMIRIVRLLLLFVEKDARCE